MDIMVSMNGAMVIDIFKNKIAINDKEKEQVLEKLQNGILEISFAYKSILNAKTLVTEYTFEFDLLNDTEYFFEKFKENDIENFDGIDF